MRRFRAGGAGAALLLLVGALSACGPTKDQNEGAPDASAQSTSVTATPSAMAIPSVTATPSTSGTQGSQATSTSAPAPTPSGTPGRDAAPGIYQQLTEAFTHATHVDAQNYDGLVTDVGFRTYKGGITCGFVDKTVTCQLIGTPSFDPPLDCHGMGTLGVVFTDGTNPQFKCMGDVESGGGVIKDGLIVTVGDLQCVSQSEGVTCIDGDGHGFLIGLEYYRLTGSA